MKNYENSLIDDYHALHLIPEEGGKEFETERYIKNRLIQNDIPFLQIKPTGLIVYFNNKAKDTIAFRAEMDGLPIEEETAHKLKSMHKGYMHACGHDGHMSILINLCLYLKNNRVNYNVVCLFQPSEEKFGGSTNSLEYLKRYAIKHFYTIHLWPGLTKGKIYYRKGAILASSTEINIKISGQTSHIGSMKNGIDALRMATKFINLKAKNGVYNIGALRLQGARNIVAGEVILEGSMRFFNEHSRQKHLKKINLIARKLMKRYNGKIAIEAKKFLPAVINANSSFECEKIKGRYYQADDFGVYKKIAPISYFLLGIGEGIVLHSNAFVFEEKILFQGFAFYIKLLNGTY